MKFLIIGLGSMGKRRVRNLQFLKAGEIIGLEISETKRKEVEEKYHIATTDDIKSVDLARIDALIISTPPDRHNEWIEFAIKNKKPAFVEASVLSEGLSALEQMAAKEKVLIAPSCTFRFYAPLKIIKEIVKSGTYGKVTNFSYHLGQYLPDWHPWEKVGDSYTGKKETSGAREMVAFELTWLVDIVGMPKDIVGFYGKTMDFGVDIDDTYAISLKLEHAFGNLTVDTTARYAIRSLILNLEEAQLQWRWDVKLVKLYNAKTKEWQELQLPGGKSAVGYNENIVEDMYIDEMASFIGAVKGESAFPNTLKEDIEVLELLNKVEKKK